MLDLQPLLIDPWNILQIILAIRIESCRGGAQSKQSTYLIWWIGKFGALTTQHVTPHVLQGLIFLFPLD
jgi:hypothetical protein